MRIIKVGLFLSFTLSMILTSGIRNVFSMIIGIYNADRDGDESVFINSFYVMAWILCNYRKYTVDPIQIKSGTIICQTVFFLMNYSILIVCESAAKPSCHDLRLSQSIRKLEMEWTAIADEGGGRERESANLPKQRMQKKLCKTAVKLLGGFWSYRGAKRFFWR